MKWVLFNNKHAALHEYRLMDDEICKVIVKYSPQQHSARITCGTHQRLFFIETSGSFKPKTVFKNEYGLEIGSLAQESLLGSKGTVIINEKKYHYTLKNDPLATLMIYDKNPDQPLVSCGLKTDYNNNEAAIALSNNTKGQDNSCLLLGLCWYLFLPVAKENVVEYAM